MSRCDRGLASDQVSTGTGKVGKDELKWSREGTGEHRGAAEAGESWEPVEAEGLDRALASPQLIYHLSCTWAAGQ